MTEQNNSLGTIHVLVVEAPSVPGNTPIGHAAQLVRFSDAAGVKIVLPDEGWAWVARGDVLMAARLGATQAPMSRLVGTVRSFPMPRRPIRLTQVTRPAPDPVRAPTLMAITPPPRRGQLRPASRLVPATNRGR